MDNKQLIKLLSYFTMGDGGVYPEKKGFKFIMNMTSDHLDYITWVKSVIENITSCILYERKDYNIDGYNRKPQTRIESKVHPIFKDLRERIYTDKYKSLDPHALKLLDAEALAILYMCDGCLYIDKPNEKKGLINPSYNITLNLKRLCYADQFLLKKTLKENLDLEWNINKQNSYYFLRLRNKDINKFINIISPFILPSFKYKIILHD